MRLSAEQDEYRPARSLKAFEVASLEKMMMTDMNSVDKYAWYSALLLVLAFKRKGHTKVRFLASLKAERSIIRVLHP